MNLSWEWKLFLLNTLCQCVFLMYTSLSLLIGLRTTLPKVYEGDTDTLFNRQILAVVIFANVVGNYLCIKLKSRFSVFSFSKRNQNLFVKDNGWSNNSNHSNNYCMHLPSSDNGVNDAANVLFDECDGNINRVNKHTALNLAGWFECRECDTLTPPRSKHCALCRACILKRDHHCFFSGCCIGFHNQRYFIFFCLYAAFGASYSTYATFTFIQQNYEFFQQWGLISHFPPVFLGSWILGHTSGRSLLFVLFQYWGLFTGSICLYFLLFQIFLIVRGQTKYELKKNVFPYKSDFISNVMSVFGPSRISCVVGLLIPAPFVGYFGDGKSWDELCQSTKAS